ncbi:hypothetical protein [Zoogloea sp.]|uniref:hypothetical protein n=1 Tax=Zoogloea sp. TaxID=49181 RepID=UPI00260754FE|nr:hypothetical protein [Zoogloea sp.]
MLRIQQAFQGSLEGRLEGQSPALTAAAWIKFFHRIAALHDSEREGRSGNVPGLHRLERAIAVNRQVADLLSDWPRAFHRYLATQQGRAAPSFSLPHTFGRLYQWLYADLSAGEFAFLREAFEAYLHQRWWGLLCRRNRRLSPHITDARKTVQAIAEEAGTTASRVRQLYLAGWIDADIAEQASGRRVWSFPTSQVAPVAALIADGLTLKAAAAYLQLPRRRVRELIESGLIQPVLSAEGHRTAAWLLSRRELDGLCGSDVSRPALDVAKPSLDSVSLGQILKAWRLEVGAFPALVKALQAGELSPCAANTGRVALGAMCLFRQEVQAWMAQWRRAQDADISITDAARALGLKEQVAFELVRTGLLKSRPSLNGSMRRIPLHELESFKVCYVALAEVARTLGTSSRHALAHLDMSPVTGPSVDGCRQYFYLRKEVAHLLGSLNPYSQEHRHDEP